MENKCLTIVQQSGRVVTCFDSQCGWRVRKELAKHGPPFPLDKGELKGLGISVFEFDGVDVLPVLDSIDADDDGNLKLSFSGDWYTYLIHHPEPGQNWALIKCVRLSWSMGVAGRRTACRMVIDTLLEAAAQREYDTLRENALGGGPMGNPHHGVIYAGPVSGCTYRKRGRQEN